MWGSQRQPNVTLLDACAVLSLYATRHMGEVISTLPGRVAVVDLVLEEALYIRRIVEGDAELEPVDLSPLVTAGLLAVLSPASEEELETFVDLAVDLDDGEAMTAALAIHRGSVLITDDRKAERLLAGRVQLRPTLELIKAWAEAEHVSGDRLRAVLVAVYERGYQPSRRHPLKPWWDASLSGG